MERSFSSTENTLAFLIFLPFLLLLFPGFSQLFDGLAFWIAMFICASIIWLMVFIRTAQTAPAEASHKKRTIEVSEYPQVIKQVMDVDLATEENGIRVFRGQLTELANVAHERLQEALKDQTVILLPVRDAEGHCSNNKGGRAAVMLVAKTSKQTKGGAQQMLDWVIIAITLGTSLFVGFR
jgi:hypothetical protein